MVDQGVRVLLGALGPLLMLAVVLWLALGGRPRRAERRELARHRGGRRTRARSIWGLPARDQALAPGGILLVLAAASLAEVVLDTAASPDSDVSLVMTAVFLGAVLAIGFAVRPDLVGTGLGLLGITTIAVSRLGGVACAEGATASQNALWFLCGVAFCAAVVVLRAMMAPVTTGGRIIRGVAQPFLTSPGRQRALGPLASTSLVAFGILGLLDLVLRPAGLSILPEALRYAPVLIAVAAGSAVVIGFGLTVLPEFTTSAVGIGVGFGALILTLADPTPCHDTTLFLFLAGGFIALAVLAKRLL